MYEDLSDGERGMVRQEGLQLKGLADDMRVKETGLAEKPMFNSKKLLDIPQRTGPNTI